MIKIEHISNDLCIMTEAKTYNEVQSACLPGSPESKPLGTTRKRSLVYNLRVKTIES